MLYADLSCVIRFTYAETDQGKTSDPHVITVLCGQFEAGKCQIGWETNWVAAKHAEKARAVRANDGSMFSLKDLDWFSSNSYTCAVKGCETWEPLHIMSISDSCLKVPPWMEIANRM